MLHLTPVDEIPKIRTTLRASFKSGKTRPLSWRRNQLRQLARMFQENLEAFAGSLKEDMEKPREEVYVAELGPVIWRATESARKLGEWAKPDTGVANDVEEWQRSWNPTVYCAPRGTTLIIAPWNYPIILTMQPLIGAISAGCTAIVKPSELAPHYAALLAELLPKYLDTECYQVVNAEIEGTTKLLELQWDYILYTGNGKVARIIAAAAAKHLTPMTLELGGKSPVLIDPTSDLRLAAKRTLYGKINNSGQICVCPDYVLIPREKQDEFVGYLKEYYEEFYPDGALGSKEHGRVVSKAHFRRVKGLLERTGGCVVVGGRDDGGRKMETTVVRDVGAEDSLMEEEIFGPVLPIVPVKDLEEAIEFVNERPHPLVLYAFTQNPKTKQMIIEKTTSGGIAFNDTFQQLAATLPFGGVGESGYGRQVMKNGFDAFSYYRSCVDVPKESEDFLSIRYPPYNEQKFAILSAAAIQTEIPGLEKVVVNGVNGVNGHGVNGVNGVNGHGVPA